jgi:hypothetical protein
MICERRLWLQISNLEVSYAGSKRYSAFLLYEFDYYFDWTILKPLKKIGATQINVSIKVP